jgi:aminoglycoside/choline kinase family phosphotransferase
MIRTLAIQFEDLFQKYFGDVPQSITPLPQGGSDRRYFRISSDTNKVIGAYNPDIDENRVFFYLTSHFKSLGFPVPELLGISDDETTYLLSDLGDDTLFNQIIKIDWGKDNLDTHINLIKRVLGLLAQVQVNGAKGLDFSKCYPKAEFDLQSVMWDFNYFKYSFLKPAGIRFNETKLEDDFLSLAKILLNQPKHFFHYRDFQSRNVMILNNEPYLIDYQGGRKGPLLYDVASFLYQARASFPDQIKADLLEYYLTKVGELTTINKDECLRVFPLFALFRVIQTLGAYGFRGFFERRTHFLQSIPLAAANLKDILEKLPELSINFPALKVVLEEVYNKFGAQNEQTKAFDGLTVEINSFSFKKGYPLEHPEHGGGFVFDCRALPNPGRLNQYKMLTGLDQPVIDYLNEHSEVSNFFEDVKDLVLKSITVYQERGFKHLSISFGCTGGQHRSVFMANFLSKFLNQNKNLNVVINHREIKEKH